MQSLLKDDREETNLPKKERFSEGSIGFETKPERANRCVRNGSEYDHNLFPTLFGVFRRFFIIVNGHTDGRTYGHTDEQTFL